MAKHIETGKSGEALAIIYLQENHFQILEKNWRHVHWEVDLIASKDTVLHFVEIKTRRSTSFGFPEEDVSRKKIENLMNASEEYCLTHPGWKRIQFDVLAINLGKNADPAFFFIEDVGL